MKICEQCGKEFNPRCGKPNRFCSLPCAWKGKIGVPAKNSEGLKLGHGWNKGKSNTWVKGDKNSRWKGGKAKKFCQECGNEYETWQYLKNKSKYCSKKCSLKNTGVGSRKVWNKGITGEASHSFGNHHTLGKPQPKQRGVNHHSWKGGATLERKSHYQSLEYREWRRKVFERDDYTCQRCRERGVKLEAHHIEQWSDNIELRYHIDNGITFCENCHASVDKYRARWKGQKAR